jgi:hypothetical protein
MVTIQMKSGIQCPTLRTDEQFGVSEHRCISFLARQHCRGCTYWLTYCVNGYFEIQPVKLVMPPIERWMAVVGGAASVLQDSTGRQSVNTVPDRE